MSKHSFKTFADALSAGYDAVNRRTDRDTSGTNSYGYSYENEVGRKTVTVWFSEDKNAMGQPGCFRPMYPPEE